MGRAGNIGQRSSKLDFVVINYALNGKRQWVAASKDLDNEYAVAFAVDNSGNVYVTGYVDPNLGWPQFMTVKFNSLGEEEWHKRYSGGGGPDKPDTLALDDVGNPYIAGWSSTGKVEDDFVLIKYSTDGIEQWISRSNYRGRAIAFDDSSNIYMAGSVIGTTTNSIDYLVAKYNSNGTEQWTASYNSQHRNTDVARAIAVDSFGRIYVSGYTSAKGLVNQYDISRDYTTIRYRPDGTRKWKAVYDGPGNSDDRARAVAVDASGNVVVTGSSYALKTGHDLSTIKYNNSGSREWDVLHTGQGTVHDEAAAVVSDAAGNIIVTGWSSDSVSSNYTTIKYDAAGQEQWVAYYDGLENLSDHATALAVDAIGNIYVTGWSWSGSSSDYVTVKYHSDGRQEWLARYNGKGNRDDEPVGITLDSFGNVYVTGWSYGKSTARDYVTIKYNSAGEQEWQARYNGPANGDEWAAGLAVDDSGNVYITGSSWDEEAFYDYATVKYNAAGRQQWVARYAGSADDFASSLAIDAAGNTYVIGRSFSSVSGDDYLTVKYNATGVQEWERRYNGEGNGDDYANAIYVVPSGRYGGVYVTGTSLGAGSAFDLVTLKYDDNGRDEWLARYNGPGNSTDRAVAITMAPASNDGAVYVTGWSSREGWSVFTTIKYTQDIHTSVSDNQNNITYSYALAQNYPNPFNPSTKIGYALPAASHVALTIYNFLGQKVGTLVDEIQQAGKFEIEWNASGLPSGIYVYRLQAGDFIKSQKLLLLK